MKSVVWPVAQMAEILGGSVHQHQNDYTIRWKNPDLGVKCKLDVGTETDDIRLVVDRLVKRRPNFIGSLALENVVGVELDREHREVRICSADGLSLAISAGCTVQLYRPV